MTEKRITVDTIRWHSVLPWLHLLRAAQLALRVRVVLLAMSAVLVFGAIGARIQLLPFHSQHDKSLRFVDVLVNPVTEQPHQSHELFPIPQDESNADRWLFWPLRTVVAPADKWFETCKSWSDLATGWTDLLWSLLVWSTFGGAMTRIIAVRFARDESVRLRAALKFSLRNWQSYIYSPLLPLLGVTLFVLMNSAIAGLDRFTGGGGTVLFLLGMIRVACGLAATLLLVLTAVSWPLMVAAISTEGSDGFDGLSRAFGYVMNRPWFFVWLVALASGLGMALLAIIGWVLRLDVAVTDWSIGLKQDDIWRQIPNLINLGVFVSYFWSATTVIYFLLRQSDDGTPLDQVYIPGPPPKPEPLPLVGVAASQQPVIEQPATEASDTATTPQGNT